MSAKHTPGPWIAVGRWVEHPKDNVPDICTCAPESMGQEGRSDEEACANARLIAAAPRLLASLEELLRFAEFHGTVTRLNGEEIAWPCITEAREAIAQAKGRKA